MSATAELDAAGIEGAGLRASYLACRRLNFVHGKTFFLATMLLPAAKRPHVHALYGFARHADDLVDEHPGPGRAEHFARWSEQFLRDLDWGSTADPLCRAVLDTAASFAIPHDYFAQFLESMHMDLHITRYDTYEDLVRYMWGSAAVIGLEMLPVLGRADDTVPWHALEPAAADLGMAFQLTNFLRDLADDLRRGRIYLPQSSLARFGVDRARLERGLVDEPIRNLMAFEIERAREYYRRAAPGIDLVAADARDCLRTAATLYGEILDAIERSGYDVFSRRRAVGLRRRAAVGLEGALRARRARRATPTAPA